MNTAVLVFENEETVCLKTLAKTIDGLPFAVRVFPLLVEDQLIIKRWALLESEQGRSFVEKEERIPTVAEFTETLKGHVCTVVFDRPSELQISTYFMLSSSELSLRLLVEQVVISSKQVADIYEGITKAVLTFFNKRKLELRGIRVKNSQGKKETVNTAIYLDKPPGHLPENMQMVQKKAEGVEVKKCLCHVPNRVLQKILQRNCLVFVDGAGQVFLKLEMVGAAGSHVFATVLKDPSLLTIIDSAQDYMKEQYNRRFLGSLPRKYGEGIKSVADAFVHKEEKEPRASFEPNTITAMGLSHEAKYRVLEGVLDMLNTLVFHPADKRTALLTSLHKVYAEELKSLKKDGLKTGAVILLAPGPSRINPASLHYLVKENRCPLPQLNEKPGKNLGLSSK